MDTKTTDPARLNQGAAHDTGLYDPARHDNQIVALYETDAEAQAARETVVGAGYARSAMQILAREDGTPGATGDSGGGLWDSIKSLFVPDEERSIYNTAVARGHAMLVVTPDASMDRQRLVRVLEETGPLDFDARLEEWRQAGYEATPSDPGPARSNVATAGHAIDGGLNTRTTGDAVPKSSLSERATPPSPAVEPSAQTSSGPAQPADERLRVGTREVSDGAARVRSYIAERPVEGSVRPGDVGTDRRPMDRPLAGNALDASRERTIEAQATSEEPAVSRERA